VSTAFSGVEPLVGEVVGLRTFRVDESGLLLPLYSDLAWYDGANTATCAPPTGDRGRREHMVPAPDCECGFYAYGSERATSGNRHARYVQAVVSCWGGVIAGTQGVRAQHARVDAIWLHPNTPVWLRRRVSSRYPSARLYCDRAVMLAEHPLSRLACYGEPGRRRALPQLAGAAVGVAVLALALLPASVLRGLPALRLVWLVATIGVGALTVWLLAARSATGHRAAAVVTAGVFAWLVAPLFGPLGWLLRVPLLRAFAFCTAGWLRSLRPGFFPVEHSPRGRAFCGVHA
jgi:hypothetical protein